MGTITAINLAKAYRHYPTRWARLAEWIIPFSRPRHIKKWVLQDVNFTINAGEAIGIIGVNGAGKSTLLKMITGTTLPTVGSVHTTGRISALLELGIGFHPEFSGRQNVFMAAQLQGMTKKEILDLLPDIESFAEIGDYIDQPLRLYSSGMQVRLAFSVATAIRPDILIVDEALAVGDIFFQQKCFDRIRKFIESGTTMLFVSHSISTILELCSRAIYIHDGRIVYDGNPKEAADMYQADGLKPLAISKNQIHPTKDDTLSTKIKGQIGSIQREDVVCLGVRLLNSQNKEVTTCYGDENMTLEISYLLMNNFDDPHIGFKIRNRQGVVFYETNSYCMHKTIGPTKAGATLVGRFTFQPDILPGEYTITVGLSNSGYGVGSFKEILSYLHGSMSFSIIGVPNSSIWAGIVNLNPKLVTEIILNHENERNLDYK